MVFTWLLGRLLPQPSGGYASPLYPPQKSRWRTCSEHLKAGRASLWILVVEMAGWWVVHVLSNILFIVHVVSNILFIVIVSGICIDLLFSSTLVPGTCNSYMYPYWSIYCLQNLLSLLSLSLPFLSLLNWRWYIKWCICKLFFIQCCCMKKRLLTLMEKNIYRSGRKVWVIMVVVFKNKLPWLFWLWTSLAVIW